MTEPKFTKGFWYDLPVIKKEKTMYRILGFQVVSLSGDITKIHGKETVEFLCGIALLDTNKEKSFEEQAANARLIAAAPDMYAALKEAMRHIPTDYDDQLLARGEISALLEQINGEESE